MKWYNFVSLPAHPKNRHKFNFPFLGFLPCCRMTIFKDYMCDLFSECFWYLVKKNNILVKSQ